MLFFFKVSIVIGSPSGLSQVLTEEFRMKYCRLWQALINKDLEAVRKYSEQLNAGQLYRLLASMICARAWDSIASGIDQAPMSQNEVLHASVA